MARPTQLRMVGDKEPRQYIWEAVRDLRSGFTPREIAKSSGQKLASVIVYINALSKASLIQIVDDRGQIQEHRWRLMQDEGVEYPKVNSKGARVTHGLCLENLWRTLRILGEVSAEEAAEMASLGGTTVAQSYAHNYFMTLGEAGYVIVNRHNHRRAPTFTLAPNQNTGPRHPVVQRIETVQVFDPNKNEVVFSAVRKGGITKQSEPDNDMRQENIRLRKLLAEVLETGQAGVTVDLLQRVQLELAE